MSEAPPQPEGPRPGGSPPGEEAPSEEELRARIEQQLREVRVQDVLLESVVTIINLTARRIGKEDERDLGQAKVGIDAVRAVVDLLEAEPQAQVRNALSELQVLYAQHAGEGPAEAPEEGGESETPQREAPPPEPSQPERPREPGGPGGLWVPPGA
jgi:hypothetical protein